MNPNQAFAFFTSRFEAEGTAERAVQEKKYLKSSMEHYGVPVPKVRAAVKEFKKEKGKLDRGELLELVCEMWSDPHYEIKSASIALLEAYRSLLLPGDMDLLEGMLDECETWAHVDWIAPHVSGYLVERHPECEAVLDRWAKHGNFWVRRGAMLSLLKPVRTRGDKFDRFARYAESMLDEKEFFIRKAIGWILREASKKNPLLAYDFLKKNLSRTSGLTFKEGSRKLPDEMRLELEALRKG